MVEFLNELIKDFNNNNIRFNNADTGIFITARKPFEKMFFKFDTKRHHTWKNGLYKKIAKTANRLIACFSEDDDLGIPQEELKNVFKPFYRLDKAEA